MALTVHGLDFVPQNCQMIRESHHFIPWLHYFDFRLLINISWFKINFRRNLTLLIRGIFYKRPIMSSETGVNANVVEREVLPPEYYVEDAIDYDDYGIEDEEGPYMTDEQKLQRLREFDKQVEDKDYCPWRLDEVYPSPPAEITTRQQLEEWEDEQYKRIDEARKKKEEIRERCELEKHLRDATKP